MKNDVLRVLIVSPLPPPSSGIGSWTESVLCEAAKRSDLEIAVVDTSVRWRTAANLSPVVRIPGGSVQAVRDICRTFAALVRHRPNVIHLNTSGSLATIKDIAILWIARRLRVASVIHYHIGTLPDTFRQKSLPCRLISRAMRLADTVVVLTRESELCTKDAMPEIEVKRLPNPIDLDNISALAKDCICRSDEPSPVRILFLGHVAESKGVGDLVSACARLKDTRFVLDIVGPVEKKYKECLIALSGGPVCPDWLRFHGEVDHNRAIQLLASCDIFALPSLTEAFPYVVAEAMACGIPIVATRVGAIPDMVGDGSINSCGACVQPGDIDALLQALEGLLSNRDNCSKMGAYGRLLVQQFSLPEVFRDLDELWCKIAKE